MTTRADLMWKGILEQYLSMRRSTVIATCLVNSNMIPRLEDAENRVHGVFLDEFPGSNFNRWNRQLDEQTARNIIRNVGRASRINVRMFIQDLAEIPAAHQEYREEGHQESRKRSTRRVNVPAKAAAHERLPRAAEWSMT